MVIGVVTGFQGRYLNAAFLTPPVFVSTKDGFRRWHVHVFGEGGNQVYESDISFNFIRDDIFRPAFGIFSKNLFDEGQEFAFFFSILIFSICSFSSSTLLCP